jgi:hypothetical protein
VPAVESAVKSGAISLMRIDMGAPKACRLTLCKGFGTEFHLFAVICRKMGRKSMRFGRMMGNFSACMLLVLRHFPSVARLCACHWAGII